MGRNAIPIDLLEKQGNKHMTNDEIEQRRKAENIIQKLGFNDLSKIKYPSKITNNKNALKYWKDTLGIYKKAIQEGIEVLALSDLEILADYCIICSRVDKYTEIHDDIIENDIDNLVLLGKIDSIINRNMKLKLDIQNKLFLNPLARIKFAFAQREPEKNDVEEMFDV